MEEGTSVILKTFLGTLKPEKTINPCDNYWKLIGAKGKISEGENDNGRVLVLFDRDLDDLELANHNPVINSLWIKTTDLEFSISQE